MRRALCAALILFSTPLGWAAPDTASQKTPETPAIDRIAIDLADAARNLPSEARLQSNRAVLSIVLLSKFNRLLPSAITTSELEELANVFLVPQASAARQNALANRLPPADSLVFDGSRLMGGNFRNIDSLLGMDGRPIALNRELPTWIVPLTPTAAAALEAQRQQFQATPASSSIADLTNRIYQANIGGNLVADGIFLRPYAGRIDDLYHHLAQQGNDATGLDFYALLDSLPPRQYSPVSGTASRASVPASRFNLSDVLTGGSFYAIQKFRSENPKSNVKNPFKGLAVRLLPFLGAGLRETGVGSQLRISGDTMRRAIADPRRFTPGKVPPLFQDPSRFLGRWADPRFVPVSKKKKKSASAALWEEIQKVDFETPLPEMNLDPAGNELLGLGKVEDSQELPEAIAEESSADLMRDLGLPEETPTPAPISRTPPQPTPTPPIFTADFRPAPPALELETSTQPDRQPIEIVLATPPPAPEPTPQPTPEATPTPLEESVLVVDLPKPTPAPTEPPAIKEEVAASTPTPTPKTREPSAVALIGEKDLAATPKPTPLVVQATPTPEPTATPAEQIKVAKAIPVEPRPDSALSLLGEPAAPTTSTSRFQVAALAPTSLQAVEYLKTIAASDTALADNMAEFNRAECYIRWLGEAVKPFEPEITRNPDSEESNKIEKLMAQVLNEVIALKARRDELKASRLKELEARHAARAALEKEIQTTRRDELSRLTGVGA